jgi:microsomal dipeptidase-like Zn-dependent dipeptidase
MNNSDFIVDIHCHPNMKAFNSGHPLPLKNIWENILHECPASRVGNIVRDLSKDVLKESQSNFYKLIEGNVRVIMLSLYPIESGFLKIRNIPKLLIGQSLNDIIAFGTGYTPDRIAHLRDQANNYFDFLLEEYNFVKQGQGKSPDGKYSYKIVNNYQELEENSNDPNAISVILSCEGAHSVFNEDIFSKGYSKDEIKDILTKNIAQIKAWDNRLFVMNLAHHFWNKLCGHATSMKGPARQLYNQSYGKDREINSLGIHVLRELQGTHNGKRIYIDIKHMSVKTRREYFDFVKNFNFLCPENKIPILCTHSGVNGYKTLQTSVQRPDNDAKLKNSYFNNYSLNLSDEDIENIYDSNGLLGIMVDKGVIGGYKVKQKIKSLKNEQEIKEEYLKLFLDNIFHTVKVINKKDAWDIICLGSDYDGAIAHIDGYEDATKLPVLRTDLIEFLNKTKYKKELWFDYSPEKMMEKFFTTNAMDFFKKYFV